MWLGERGICVAGGMPGWGAGIAGGKGTCVAGGGMCGWGHVWLRGRDVWLRGACMTGCVCMVGTEIIDIIVLGRH